MMKEFVGFLKEYQVIGLAIAVIIGSKAAELVKTVVDQLVMPFVGLLVPGGDWRTMSFSIAESKFGVGMVIGATIDFIIVAALIFLFAKLVLKETTITKK
jgi:large conductance mechanosensitive channel